jgi:septal ring factor EnvC (AmiA/AmiB activator)
MTKKMNDVIRLIGVALVSAVISESAFGANVKGKPFVELQGQIVEVQGEVSDVQDQVESLVAQVDTIEERVVANQDAIATLEVANSNLEVLISTSSNDIASIQNTIDSLQSETTALQQQVASTGGDVSGLQQQIADNQALLQNLQSALAAVQNGVITLETDLQAQIDSNSLAISALQYQIDDINSMLALKQNHLNGQCSEGYALRAINADGSIFCVSISGGSLEVAYSEVLFGVNYSQHKIVTVACNPGYVLTGGGYHLLYFIQPTRIEPIGNQSVEIGAVNWDHINNTNIAYAFCMRLSP